MELSIAYEITGSDGTRVVIGNGDPARLDADWVGYLDPDNGITGLLDGADVRETSYPIVEGDGAEPGAGYLGARPGTIQGIIDPNAPTVVREGYVARLKRATNALRTDCVLRWTPTNDGIRRRLRLRRSGRPSFPGRQPQTFQLSMTSPDPYVLSEDEASLEVTPGGVVGEVGIPDPIVDPILSELAVSAQAFVANAGSAPTWARFRLDGPVTNPEIMIVQGFVVRRIKLAYVLGAGEWLDIRPEYASVLLGGTADRYRAVDFAATDWWKLTPGNNDVRLLAVSFGAGAKLTVSWRHAWE